MAEPGPRLYSELASWFHLLTAPEDYAEEAEMYRQIFCELADSPPGTLLELGSGGGNNASHLKRHFACTLTDLSPDMLELSRSINPECEHIQGDMRTVRLGRTFDIVLVHDAVMYMLTLHDLRRTVATAFVHCRPGGVAIFAPDCTRETFLPATRHGGHDGDGRALRYLEWTRDPDPSDTACLVEFAYLLHEDGKSTRCEYDRHEFGLFGRADWLRLLGEVGFQAGARPYEHNEETAGQAELFVGIRPRPSQ
jgi:SAM-dependent methyltransferase